jgi:hypothetical protein
LGIQFIDFFQDAAASQDIVQVVCLQRAASGNFVTRLCPELCRNGASWWERSTKFIEKGGGQSLVAQRLAPMCSFLFSLSHAIR